MVTYDDWSQLITVNYKSGAGGDFFSIILDKNFNDNIARPYTKTLNYRYRYKNCPFHFHVKKLNMFNFLHNNRININNTKSIPYREIEKKIYKTFVDFEIPLEECLKQYCYDVFSHNFKNNKYRVTNVHNFNDNYLNTLDLQILFPKSHNINFYTKNKAYIHILDFVIFPWKVFDKNQIVNKNNFCVSEIIIEDKDIQDNPNGLHIDPFDLFMLGKNYDDILSEFLGEKIILDRHMLQTYKNEIIEICKACDIDPLKDYNLNVITEKAIKMFNSRFENE